MEVCHDLRVNQRKSFPKKKKENENFSVSFSACQSS